MTQLEIKKELQDGLKLGIIKFHHSSLRRGYLCKNASVFEKYCGRFGHGIILKTPNSLDTQNHSNRYYTINYFLYVEKTIF